jgi:replicative superfamily II helicase
MRALFGIALSRNWGPTASVILSLCKSIDRRMWSFQHPLVQFDLRDDMMTKIEKLASDMTMEALDDMDGRELGDLLHNVRMGDHLRNCVRQFPKLSLTAHVSPLTRTILKICLEIIPTFQWNDRVHGSVEPFHIWVEDSENTEILYSDYLLIHKKQNSQPQLLEFTVPLPETNSTSDGLPTQLFIRSISDKWHGAESILPVSFKHLLLPEEEGRSPHTDLLPLRPISIKALQDPVLESICSSRFQYFNPVQTQVFHILYHTRENVLLGAPTGSGKTAVAELALWSAFRDFPSQKVVYIAPLKALVRERVQDWRQRLMPQMKRKLVELTGDITPDLETIQNADIIITTPEKWDGVSRSWKSRGYVSSVSCIIIDEIHLLGGDRGPILEVIVSRMNYISSQRDQKIRIIGLSTALANASDLADWLGIGNVGLFNFRHSVRPVPLEIYIEGHPGKHCMDIELSINLF